jgi:hypothetical protein
MSVDMSGSEQDAHHSHIFAIALEPLLELIKESLGNLYKLVIVDGELALEGVENALDVVVLVDR